MKWRRDAATTAGGTPALRSGAGATVAGAALLEPVQAPQQENAEAEDS